DYLDAETWEWDGTSWSQKFPAHTPSARAGGSMAFDSKRGIVVMVGGYDGFVGLSDLWTWDGTDWSNPVPEGTPNVPVDRVGEVLAYDSARDKIVLYGGKNQGIGPSEDCSDALWEWDGAAWTKIALSPAAELSARTFGCSSGFQGYYDEARGATTLTNAQW